MVAGTDTNPDGERLTCLSFNEFGHRSMLFLTWGYVDVMLVLVVIGVLFYFFTVNQYCHFKFVDDYHRERLEFDIRTDLGYICTEPENKQSSERLATTINDLK